MTFDAQKWTALQNGSACPMCLDPDDEHALAELPSGRVLLMDDGDFPGYCILVCRRHVTELHELTQPERVELMEDVARIASAVWSHCGPTKLNYAILGNEVPHLHCHIIPRYPDDGWWGRAIWLRPAVERRPLAAQAYVALGEALRSALAANTE